MKSMRRFLALMFILVLNVTATTLDVTPDPGETDVLQNVVVKAVFPEPLDPASVTQESVKLMHDDPLTLWELLELLLGYGNEDALYVEGTVAYDEATRTLSFTPGTSLRAGEYRATVSNMLRTSDGGWPLLIPAQWNFTVGENATPTLSELNISADALQIEVGETTALHAQGHYSDGSVQDLNAEVNWTLSDSTVANIDANGTLHGLSVGVVSVTATYEQTVSNALNIEIVAPVPVLQSLDLRPESLTLRLDASAQMSVTGHYSDGSSRDVTAEASYESNNTSVVSVSNGDVTALATGTATVTAILDGVASNDSTVTISSSGVDTSNFPPESFADKYKNTIADNAMIEQYDPERFCVVTGLVKDRSGTPLSGVRVSLFGHSGYGSSLTDEAGRFEIAAEGGGIATVVYEKAGYTTLHRQVDAPWKDIVVADAVTMLERDSASTSIPLDGSVRTHVSTPVSDTRGERSTTLVFDGVTGATVTRSDGSQQTLDTLTIRATEFETPDSMPAILPPTSAFTYCSDLTADGVSDDASITFDQPVVMYVDNFLGFDVGEIVPVGYYDRRKAQWAPSKNGVVVMLLDMNDDGTVDALDKDGDGTPDDFDGDGDPSDEATGLSDNARYQPGSTFWRAEITHFTPWDCNWPWGPPSDARAPRMPEPAVEELPKTPDSCSQTGSYVEHKKRAFHEDIPIAGTDLTLHYASDRTEGYKHRVKIPVSGSDLPASLQSIIVTLEVAGRIYRQELPPNPDQNVEFVWDGKDYKGETTSGAVSGKVGIGYVYSMTYYSSNDEWSMSFGRAGSDITAVEGRNEYVSWQRYDVHFVQPMPQDEIAAGWTVSNHHRLSENSLLVKGDGALESLDNVQAMMITTVAGGGLHYKDGVPATQSLLENPIGIAFDGEGNLYIADQKSDTVRKVDTDGIITTVAGKYDVNGSTGDGGPATQALLDQPRAVAFDKNDNLYIADSRNRRVRKVSSNGIITTVAGNGSDAFSGDGGAAVDAGFETVYDVALDRSGNLYIADYYNGRVRIVDTNGTINTFAGTSGFGCHIYDIPATEADIDLVGRVDTDKEGNVYIGSLMCNAIVKVDTRGIMTKIAGDGGYTRLTGDGGPATSASIGYPSGTVIDKNGNVLLVNTVPYSLVRKIDQNGIITTIAGLLGSGDGSGVPTRTSLGCTRDIAMAADGSIYVSSCSRVYRVGFVPLGQKYGDFDRLLVPRADGTAYLFDSSGRHLQTIDYSTGTILTTFGYDEKNQLTSITDRFNNTTTIERDGSGVPAAVVSPYGHRTGLGVDAANHLDRIAYEDGSAYTFNYTADGLMTELTDPNDKLFTHAFDANGRVTGTEDPEGGVWTLDSLFQNDGSVISSITSAEANTISHTDESESGDTFTSLTTYPTGDTALFRMNVPSLSERSFSCGMEQNVSYTFDKRSKVKIPLTVTETTPSGLANILELQRTYVVDGNMTTRRTTTVTHNENATVKIENFETGTTTTTSPEGRTVTLNVDTGTLLPSEISIAGLLPTAFDYDARGRLTQMTTGSRTQSYTYDNRGNVATATDAAGRTTGYTYDLLDRVTRIDLPDTHTVAFAYDPKGNMDMLTVPTPADHHFAYNGVDQQRSYTTPLDRVTHYAYDKERKLKSVTFPSGKRIDNVYTDGRLSQTVTAEGTTNYAYACMDNVSSVTKGSERIDYGYDGTLLTAMTQSGTLNETIGFTYKSDFNVASISYAGTTQNLGYDNDGLLTSIGAFTVTRNAQNGLAGSLTDGTLTLNRTFNGYAEVDAQSSTVGGSNAYGYTVTSRDNTGRITGKEEYLNGITTHWHYTYDSVGRLIEVNKDGTVVESYDYDANGNRIRTTSTLRGIYDQDATYTVEDAIEQVGGDTYVYDEDGWLSSKITGEGTTHYSYGTRGELRSVVKPDGTTIEYIHNANNQRVSKTVNGTVTEKYLWLDLTTLLAVYDGSGNLVSRFEYADSRLPYKMTQGGQIYYLNYDQVGTLRTVAAQDGTIVKTIEYDTFGNVLSDSNPSFKVSFGFAGGLYDTDTKLTRFGYRDYDAETGKWTAKDPIGFNGGDTNLYGYVLNDPVNFVDPSGEFLAALIPLLPYLPEIGAVALGIGYTIFNPPPAYHPMDGDNSLGDNAPYCSDQSYFPAPDSISDTFPNAESAKRKNQRKRWKDEATGDIYEWDYQHGEIEIYDKRGNHKGSINPKTGQKKPAVPGRKTPK